MVAADVLPAAPGAGRLSMAELVEVRDRLRGAGFHDDGMAPASDGADAAGRQMVLAALRDLDDGGGSGTAVLTRVFAYGDTASSAELEAVVGATAVDRLAACGLLRTTADGVVECPVQLRPLAGVLVASDRPGMAGEAVMPAGSTTFQLARALPRPPLGRVLDLGTGSGLLALLVAGAGATVTASDISERACSFTRFNAALNGLAVDVRAGDLFTPVDGERFGLVVSQPPFVVQPPDVEATTYAHGGPRGDEVALRILTGLDDVLAPGGCALLRFDAAGTQDDVVSRVRSCVPGPFDVGVFGFKTAGPDLVALGYGALADPTLGARYRREVTAYSRHLASLDLDHFTGTITMVRRPADEPRPPVTVSAAGASAPTWPYITARLAAERLAAAPDSVLLSAWLSPLPDARLTVELIMDRAEVPPMYAVRYPTDAVPLDTELHQNAAAMLQLFVGGRALAAAVEAYAEAAGTAPDAAVAEVLAFARDALRRGLLVPSVT